MTKAPNRKLKFVQARVENFMEKVEIAGYKHFFTFTTMLSIAFLLMSVQSRDYVALDQLFTTQSQLLTTPRKKRIENIVRKGENAGNQHFLLFPQCFLPFLKQLAVFSDTFILWTANAFNLDQSKNLLFGKGLSFRNCMFSLLCRYVVTI